MSVSESIKKSIEGSSWIRKMFEEGAKLREKVGAENVFDFSLGNPDLAPPEEFFNELENLIKSREEGVHGYMPNSGFPDVRRAIAEKVSAQHESSIKEDSIVMTCGAAGGMNVILKTILDPGEEVILLKPFFAEYNFYISNHGGVPVHVDTAENFSIDVTKVKDAITDKTRAIIINNPNNPTGKIYTEENLKELSDLINTYKNNGRPIFLISDEPYREIVYDNKKVPPVLPLFKNSFVVTSFSKSLSLPGERIGFIAVNSEIENFQTIMAGLNLSNRILGFVNAPALMQRVVAKLNDSKVDIESYKRRRDLLASGLKSAGYEFVEPEGAFYLFCKSPLEDDIEFVGHLQKYNILVVPGTGFGGKGYFRISYCVSEDVISRSIPAFQKALEEL